MGKQHHLALVASLVTVAVVGTLTFATARSTFTSTALSGATDGRAIRTSVPRTPTPTRDQLLARPAPTERPVVPLLTAMPVNSDTGGSSANLTVTAASDHGVVGEPLRIEENVALGPALTSELAVEYLPDGPLHSLGDRVHTAYTGSVWPSRWPVRLEPGGHFVLGSAKVPQVIEDPSGEL